MIIIVCTDDNNGMMFHQRRQSQDRVLRENIRKMISGRCLWMNAYGAQLFSGMAGSMQLQMDEKFLEKAKPGDYCFVEDQSLEPYKDRIEKVIRYRWNRVYPADHFLTLDLNRWNLKNTIEFAGSSHDKITRETYER